MRCFEKCLSDDAMPDSRVSHCQNPSKAAISASARLASGGCRLKPCARSPWRDGSSRYSQGRPRPVWELHAHPLKRGCGKPEVMPDFIRLVTSGSR
jgi:hypothetical protein